MERKAGTSKTRRLTEIVSGLGSDATTVQIREQAYRAGFGAVNAGMLIAFRNKLWPNRERRTNGRRSDGEQKARSVSAPTSLVPCPECGSHATAVMDRTLLAGAETCRRGRGCRDCGHRFDRVEPASRLGGKQVNFERWAAMTEKSCTYCKRMLPIEAFSLKSGSDVVRRPGCKECAAENRAKYIGCDLVKRYGITLDDYHAILGKQSGRCAICGTESPFGRLDNNARKRKRRTFSVDHCHATGKVRGLLCARCNLAIGNFGDDPEIMRAAIAYIETHRREPVSSATISSPEQ